MNDLEKLELDRALLVDSSNALADAIMAARKGLDIIERQHNELYVAACVATQYIDQTYRSMHRDPEWVLRKELITPSVVKLTLMAGQ